MDIAIIGLAGRFPEARSIEEFYKNLCDGRDSVREISMDRRSNTSIGVDEDYQIMGFLDDVEMFDHAFFNISKNEAQLMDPRQRFLLEVVHDVFENAGYNPEDFYGSNTSVFLGDTNLDYSNHVESFDPTMLTGNLNSITAGRISRFFNLRGSALMIDTSCSSSLVALHYACAELQSGASDQAIVAGVNLVLFPPKKQNIGQTIGIASKDGKARSFAASANGTSCGEAVACVLLKPLQKAQRDCDTIWAVIKGSAVNQDAALSGSLTAPDSVAQSEVIRKAWKQANIDPSSIGYIEAHGTGTKLGDPIEIQGLTLAFSDFTAKKKFCAVSALKSNIGHTDSAAGIAGLIKAVLALKFRKLFPSLHFDAPNPFIDFENSPVYINTRLRDWTAPENVVRRAGVSSFGMSGTNCHVVLEEAPTEALDTVGTCARDHVITVSAKDASALYSNLQELKEYVKRNGDVSMTQLSYTLNLARAHHQCRYAVICKTPTELIKLLEPLVSSANTFAKKPNKVIFVFSESTAVPSIAVDSWRKNNAAFCDAYDSCFEFAKATNGFSSPELISFAFQYGFVKMMRQLSVIANGFIGHGVGKAVIEVVSGKLRLDEAIARLQLYTVKGQNTESRIDAYLEKEQKNNLLFIEMGLGGKTSQELLPSSRFTNYKVIVAPTCKDNDDPKSVLLRELYLNSIDIDWRRCHEGISKRLMLPTYRFNRIRCWAKEPTEGVDTKLKRWLYRLEWQKTERSVASPSVPEGVQIIFMDDRGMGQKLVAEMERNHLSFIRVFRGDAFEILEKDTFKFNLNAEADYSLFKEQLLQRGISQAHVIYIATCDEPVIEASCVESNLQKSLYSPFYLVKAFDGIFSSGGFALTFVTLNARQIDDADIPAHASAALHGFMNSVREEYPDLQVKCIDVDERSISLENIVGEASSVDRLIVGYRNHNRYIPVIRDIDGHQGQQHTALVDGGVYLITGGASGIGLAIATHIGFHYKATLILVGRSELPAEDQWQLVAKDSGHKHREIIMTFLDIQTAGSKVVYHAVDLGEANSVANLLHAIRQFYGKLNGVVHAAGIPGKKRIKSHSLATFKEAITPKVHGTIHLHELNEMPLDFFVSFSSLNAIIGSERNSNYGAASLFQDSYILEISKKARRSVSINWTGWLETGMLHRILPQQGSNSLRSSYLLTKEGVKVFEYLLTLPFNNVIVSKDHPDVLGANPFFQYLETQGTKTAHVFKDHHEVIKSRGIGTELHEINDYVAALWCKVLKAESIQPEDDFFDIGGNSLSGIRVINEIERDYGLKLEIDDLFEYATVNKLSDFILSNIRLEKSSSYNGKDNAFIAEAPRMDSYPVSSAQKRMFILNGLDTSSLNYNMPSVVELSATVDRGQIGVVLQQLVNRHASLRTQFILSEDGPRQVVVSDVEFALAYTETDDDHLPQLIKDFIRPFDLKNAPLFRAQLVKTETGKFVLMTDMHHIISDGISAGILAVEFDRLYRGETLAPLPVRYVDYAVWQHQQVEKGANQSSELYWRSAFSGSLPVLELPTDFPRPASPTFEGESLLFTVPAELTSQLMALGQQHKLTPYMTFVAAYQLLLYRYSGQEDIIVGSPIAGRLHADVEQVVGMFVNTIALRHYPQPAKSLKEFLKEVRATVLSAFEHQHFPFEMLIEMLNLKRELNRNPLFDVVIDYESIVEEPTDAGVQLARNAYNFEYNVSKFDLSINFYQTRHEVQAAIRYSTRLFRRETIERMAGHLITIFRWMVADPDTTLETLSVMSEEELTRILSDFNATKHPYADQKTIHQLFEAQVLSHPDKSALVFEDLVLTYDALNRKCNQLAYALIGKHAVQPGQVIGVLCHRGVELNMALMAILKAGAAYLPIDPNFPDERIAFMLSDAGTKVVITDSPGYRCEVPTIDVCGETLTCVYENPELDIGPESLAYVIYTSGSTGRPKGVMVNHGGVVNRVEWMWNTYTFKPSDVILQKTFYGFDVSVWELFMSLGFGACQIQCKPDVVYDVAKLTDCIERHRVTTLHFVPSMLAAFLDGLEQTDEIRLRSLRHVFSSGEALSPELVARYHNRFVIDLHNLYGPTEASVDVTYYRTDTNDKNRVPIGRPIWNTEIYVLDSVCRPVPVGVEGEIYIGGVGLGRGYINDCVKTDERFVPHPFRRGQKLYKTGDRGRWRHDGNVEYIGRSDFQVKIRGYRIELAEIESYLQRHADISSSVVVVTDGPDRDKQLVAYYVADAALPAADLRQFLAKGLPQYMVPVHFIRLEKLPLTANGKTDRNGLPKVTSTVGQLGRRQAPETITEEILAGVWGDILGRHVVGRNDNFFDLGGHSLRAIVLVARLRKIFEVDLMVTEVFASPTVALLGRVLESKSKKPQQIILPAQKQSHYPLSSAQKRMFILHQMNKESIAYNMPSVFSIDGDLDINALKAAVAALVKRHASLRTRFVLVDDLPMQQVDDYETFDMPIQEFDTADETETRNLVSEFVEPFDLRKGPLFRVAIVRAKKEQQYLLLTDMHHIISDGVSLDILTVELGNLYAGTMLTPSTLQYVDYAVWQSGKYEAGQYNKEEKFWLERFAGELSVLQLPYDFPRPPRQDFAGDTVVFSLPEAVIADLRKTGREKSMTSYMVFLAAYNILLYKYTGLNDIIVGAPIAGRSHADVEGMIGLFVNTLAMRNYPTPDKSVDRFLTEVRATVLQAFEHEEYPFEELIDKLNLRRDPSRNPLLDTLLEVRHEAENSGGSNQGIGVKPYFMDYKISKFDLSVKVVDTPEKVDIIITYCTGLFKTETVHRLGNHYLNVIRQVASPGSATIGSVNIMDNEEEEKFTSIDFSAVQFPDETIHSIFKRRAAKTPDSVALAFEHELVTYRQVDQWSDCLAAKLIGRDIGEGDIVAVVTGRTPETIVSILAVLKSRAAYLPIDPDTPVDRIAFMLEDSNASLVLARPGNLVANAAAELIEVSFDWLNALPSGANDVIQAGRPTDLAYVIYTSGSTGRPKGVMIEHAQVVQLLFNENMPFDFSESDCWTLFHSTSFDFSVWEMMGALLYGGRLIIVPLNVVRVPMEFAKLLREERVTVLNAVPSYFYMLSDAVQSSPIDSINIRYVIFGGEKLHPSRLTYWNNVFPSCVLVNMYGITETTVHVTFKKLEPEDIKAGISDIGLALPTMQVLILDNELNLCPIGIEGEICVAGHGLSRGYLNRPDLTQERFVTHPFKPGYLIYKSGDKGKWIGGKGIEYIGRKDFQVKLRGYRIELGEIEGVLNKYPGIAQSLVILYGNADEDKMLVAYYVQASTISERELRDHLKGYLPEYMVPSAFVRLDSFSLTSNGKIDRQALPVPSLNSTAVNNPPQTTIEKKIAEKWYEVLMLGKAGVNDDFFSLGGHSLKAIVLSEKLSREFAITVPVRVIFDTPTIHGIAQYISKHASNSISEQRFIALKEGIEGLPPVFFIHDGTGELNGYVHLTRHLKLPYNMRGFRSDFLNHYGPVISTIEEIAARQLEQILAQQSTGPFQLVGWSTGGIIAFEIASQLERRGHTNITLIMIDATTPVALPGERNDFSFESECRLVDSVFGSAVHTNSVEALWKNTVLQHISDEASLGILRMLVAEDLREIIPYFHQMTLDELIRYINTIRSLEFAARRYTPRHRLKAPVVYIQAEESQVDISQWQVYMDSKLSTLKTPGSHHSMVNAHNATYLAHAVEQFLIAP